MNHDQNGHQLNWLQLNWQQKKQTAITNQQQAEMVRNQNPDTVQGQK
jgi:hypothetical protein